MAGAVGIDLVEIGRLESALLRRPRLADRLFRPDEIDYANQRRRPGRHLAARFAAKEAAVKAIGSASGADLAIPLRDIEVLGSAPPRLRLHGAAARHAATAGIELSVSMTHTDSSAAAIVLGTASAT